MNRKDEHVAGERCDAPVWGLYKSYLPAGFSHFEYVGKRPPKFDQWYVGEVASPGKIALASIDFRSDEPRWILKPVLEPRITVLAIAKDGREDTWSFLGEPDWPRIVEETIGAGYLAAEIRGANLWRVREGAITRIWDERVGEIGGCGWDEEIPGCYGWYGDDDGMSTDKLRAAVREYAAKQTAKQVGTCDACAHEFEPKGGPKFEAGDWVVCSDGLHEVVDVMDCDRVYLSNGGWYNAIYLRHATRSNFEVYSRGVKVLMFKRNGYYVCRLDNDGLCIDRADYAVKLARALGCTIIPADFMEKGGDK